MKQNTTIFKPALVILLLLLAVGVASAIRVGVGTSSPNTDLHIPGGDERILIANSTNPRYAVGIGSTHITGTGERLDFYTGDTGANNQKHNASNIKMSITADGKVGIGTTSPQATRLDLHGGGFDNLYVWRNTQTGSAYGMGTLNSTLALYTGSHSIAFGKNTGTGTFSEEWMRLKNGKVGIGTTNPSYPLTVNSPSIGRVAAFYGNYQDQGPGYDIAEIHMGLGPGANEAFAIGFNSGNYGYFAVLGNPRVVIDSTGSVGIGTINPTIDLAIGDNDTGIQQQGDGQLAFYTNNIERIRINNTGKVGIGTNNPTVLLAVGDDDSGISYGAGSLQLVEGGTARVLINSTGAYVVNNLTAVGDLSIGGKGTFTGGIDPPYISFSSETHESIKQFAKDVVEHEKAMLFWNEESHRLEVYSIKENKFYTITGEPIE